MGTEHGDGVVEERVFICPLCGSRFDDREHAKTCRESHLHFDDISIENVAVDDNVEHVFPQGQSFPAKIVVVGKGLDKRAIYVLDGYHKFTHKPKVQVPEGGQKLKMSRPTDTSGSGGTIDG